VTSFKVLTSVINSPETGRYTVGDQALDLEVTYADGATQVGKIDSIRLLHGFGRDWRRARQRLRPGTLGIPCRPKSGVRSVFAATFVNDVAWHFRSQQHGRL